jgi:hypothetical protein
MRAPGAFPRSGAVGSGSWRCLARFMAAVLLGTACASRALRFGPASAETSVAALRGWETAAARAGPAQDENLLYEAAMTQGPFRTGGTLAVRLRGERVEGTLAGPFGSPIATYSNGELRGEKLSPVRLPAEELRAVLAGIWIGASPEVAGENGAEVLLRWGGAFAAEGVFNLHRAELEMLRIQSADGQLEARFSGRRNPWPDRIEIEEKRTGSSLKLKLLSRETVP